MKKIFFIILLTTSHLFPQSKFVFDGYLENFQTVWAPKQTSEWIFSNSIGNRLNFHYYPTTEFMFSLGLRNIFDFGQFVFLVPGYDKIATNDNGYLNLSKKIASNKSAILYSNIDRLNFFYSANNWEIQIGRQRINLGINYVWTPNDIFNSSSFLNFDYIEKPGSDAIRIQYYLDFASSIQIIAKEDKYKNLTMAGVYKFNIMDYDFQSLASFTKDDFIFGGGWAGNISGAGFTGEATYFKSRKNLENVFVSSIGANCTFSNSLFLSGEFLFNSNGITDKAKSLNNIFNIDYSAKNLSPSKFSIFISTQYPITSLINLSIASIINPIDGSYFFNPSIEFSLNDDIYFLISGQIFFGDNLTEWGDFGQFYYMRLKFNF
ncbi:MAG: hypothetical protein HYS24_04440 [Ignavibacteriales bacterium]|nr:hypothetical protein [Ignavibacteriales bacterium]